MANWDLRDLEYWDDKIKELVNEFGLDTYPQEFEVCDQNAMLGYMAYHGMPSHYPHWSYGKVYEQTKTMYDHAVTGLPYEMVINSNPCLGYLMRDNSLCLQILTIAHVYGHNDFFKNNFNFKTATDARETVSAFKTRADRVRRYLEDPSIGWEAVELFLDAAHALSFNRSRNPGIRKLDRAEQRQRKIEAAHPASTGFEHLEKRVEPPIPDLNRTPLEPEEDVLLFIRDHRPDLEDWQRDLLTIVDEESRYFMPQIDTKIMNEGWASYWHHKIMNALELPQDLHMEFLVRHNQVICPHPGSINPYHVGFVIWHDIEKRFGETETPLEPLEDRPPDPTPSSSGRDKMFEVRESDRDQAFLRRFLTEELMRDLDLFAYKPRGEHLVVTKVSDEEHWAEVKQGLIRDTGSNSMPVIRVHDADYANQRGLYLVHDHDGRDLDMTHAEKTLTHLRHLWGHNVALQTRLRGKPALMTMSSGGFDAKLLT